MVFLEIVSGFLLSWGELLTLRRSAGRLLNAGVSAKGWGFLFALRYGALALAFWAFLRIFKPVIFPFVLSFILSHMILRLWYGRKVCA